MSVLDRFRYDDNEKRSFKVQKVAKKRVRKPKRSDVAGEQQYKDLQPSLDSNVDLVFVGFNPGILSSVEQHHYAHPTNLFWKLFNQSKLLVHIVESRYGSVEALISHSKGLLSELIVDNKSLVTAKNDYQLIEYHIGFTDLVLRCTRTALELSKEEKLANVPRLILEFQQSRPKFVVVIGKGIWECIVEYLAIEIGVKYKLTTKTFQWGRQSGVDEVYTKLLNKWEQLIGYPLHQYVFPNTSGLVTSLNYEQKLRLWLDLTSDVSGIEKERVE